MHRKPVSPQLGKWNLYRNGLNEIDSLELIECNCYRLELVRNVSLIEWVYPDRRVREYCLR